jgi:hypothetical protein
VSQKIGNRKRNIIQTALVVIQNILSIKTPGVGWKLNFKGVRRGFARYCFLTSGNLSKNKKFH